MNLTAAFVVNWNPIIGYPGLEQQFQILDYSYQHHLVWDKNRAHRRIHLCRDIPNRVLVWPTAPEHQIDQYELAMRFHSISTVGEHLRHLV